MDQTGRRAVALRFRISAFAGLAAVLGCGDDTIPKTGTCTTGAYGCDMNPSTGDGDGTSSGDGDSYYPSDKRLPCDVQKILADKCGDCHGDNNTYPAPMKLSTWANLHATTPTNPGVSVYTEVLARVNSETRPMPPNSYPDLTSEEHAKLTAWVQAGAPERVGSEFCAGDNPPAGDADAGNGDGDGDVGEVINPDENTYKALDQSGGPEDCETYYELRAHGVQKEYDKTPYKVGARLGNDGNQYHCFYFKPPYEAGEQALWFKPLIDKSKILHHWLLYGTDSLPHASGSSSPCSAAEPGAYLLAGWAPGAGETTMPADVGLQMPTGPVGGLILEVHYFNQGDETFEDNTGVKFCTVKNKKRTNEAAVHFTGGENICLAPNQKSTVNGKCYPTYGGKNIHITSVWPHMHKLGTRMEITIFRKNGTREVLHDEPFDFNDQVVYPKNVVLEPGDRMETNCYFDNTTNGRVPFGEKTQTEMCYGFVTAWPAGALSQDPSSFDVTDWFGLPISPARRCLKPAGILSSCNGLADYPLPR